MKTFIHLLDSTLHMPVGVADDDDDDEVKSRSRHINGATYVKSPAPGPRISVDDVDSSPQQEPIESSPTSPSVDPQFAYPQATGHITVPGMSFTLYVLSYFWVPL